MMWNNKISQKLSSVLLVVFYLISSGSVYAQPAPPPISPFGGGPGGQPNSSIEMYVAWLLLASMFMVVYYTKQRCKKSKV